MSTRLPKAADFDRVAILSLDTGGNFIHPEDGTSVAAEELPGFLSHQIAVPPDATDIFVWVHGWQNDPAHARAGANRLFAAVEALLAADPGDIRASATSRASTWRSRGRLRVHPCPPGIPPSETGRTT